MVLYFSGTGNSKYIAKRIAEAIQENAVDLNMKIKENDTSPLQTGRDVIIVTPTYAWRIPKIVSEWIDKTEFIDGKRIWFVMNCGSEIGNAAKYNQELSEQKKLQYMGTSQILMPENYIAFTTYAIVDEACTLNAADAVLGAVLRRQTIVTKGPLFTAHSEKGRVTVIFDNTSGYLDWAPAQAAAPVLELRDSTGAVQRAETDLRTPLSLSLAPGARSAVLKLYAGACAPVHLLAVGAPLYLDKEGNG